MNFETEAELREEIKELEMRLRDVCYADVHYDEKADRYRVQIEVLRNEVLEFPMIWRELTYQLHEQIKKIYEE